MRRRKIETETIKKDCDHPGCKGGGAYRAPKGPGRLHEFYWFCLDHVRQYNKSWDYYAGMGPEEIEAEIRADIVGRRPTWPLGLRRPSWQRIFARRLGWDFIPDEMAEELASHFGARPKERPRAETEKENAALTVLGLKGPIAFAEVRKVYKTLAKKYHPDANGGDRGAEEKLKLINQAYNLLKSAALQAEPALR